MFNSVRYCIWYILFHLLVSFNVFFSVQPAKLCPSALPFAAKGQAIRYLMHDHGIHFEETSVAPRENWVNNWKPKMVSSA